MGDRSTIEWTDATWNPVDGCDKVSPGCAHCYAEAWAHRGLGNFRDGRAFEDVRTHEDKLTLPLHWKRPRRVFVISMGDPFHEAVPDRFLDRVFAMMLIANWHRYQLLTKRHERMREYVSAPERPALIARALASFLYRTRSEMALGLEISMGLTDRRLWPIPNLALIVSVENQRWADARIPALLETPAAVGGISAEPLLERIDLTPFMPPAWARRGGLHWVIAGGESGHGARPFDLAWARSLRDQCAAAGVPFFLKQLGGRPIDRGELRGRFIAGGIRDSGELHDRKGGDPEEWPADLRHCREYPRLLVPA